MPDGSSGGDRMITVPVTLDLRNPPRGQTQEIAMLTRIENAIMREFGNELNEGPGVVAISMATGSHVMTTTSISEVR